MVGGTNGKRTRRLEGSRGGSPREGVLQGEEWEEKEGVRQGNDSEFRATGKGREKEEGWKKDAEEK